MKSFDWLRCINRSDTCEGLDQLWEFHLLSNPQLLISKLCELLTSEFASVLWEMAIYIVKGVMMSQCVNKEGALIGEGTKTEITLVKGLIGWVRTYGYEVLTCSMPYSHTVTTTGTPWPETEDWWSTSVSKPNFITVYRSLLGQSNPSLCGICWVKCVASVHSICTRLIQLLLDSIL